MPNEHRTPYTDEDGWTVIANRKPPRGWSEGWQIGAVNVWHCEVPRALATFCKPLLRFVEGKLGESGLRLARLAVRIEFRYSSFERTRCPVTRAVCNGNAMCTRSIWQKCPKGYARKERQDAD